MSCNLARLIYWSQRDQDFPFITPGTGKWNKSEWTWFGGLRLGTEIGYKWCHCCQFCTVPSCDVPPSAHPLPLVHSLCLLASCSAPWWAACLWIWLLAPCGRNQATLYGVSPFAIAMKHAVLWECEFCWCSGLLELGPKWKPAQFHTHIGHS